VPVNGDLFFVSPPDGDIRSIQTALKFFGTWGNVPLSSNERRVLDFNDRSQLSASSGVQFDNRLLITALPFLTPAGTGFKCVIPLDFDVLSTFEERRPPAWEGVHDYSAGPYPLQLLEGDFGGRERGFAVVYSELRQQIEVWEIRPDLRFENGENRVTRIIEFPAYPFGDPYQLKELDTAELWIDKVLGTVDAEVYYRPDGYACWIPWAPFRLCAAKDCREFTEHPCGESDYPQEPCYELDGIPLTLPKPPPARCTPGVNPVPRPSNIGYQFQMRLVTKGWCRIRGLLMHALPRDRAPYDGLLCQPRTIKLGE
jgi:hypothetical protein